VTPCIYSTVLAKLQLYYRIFDVMALLLELALLVLLRLFPVVK